MNTDRPAGNTESTSVPQDRDRVTHRTSVIIARVGIAVLLAIYWSSLFFGTHLPVMPRSLARHSDKLLHLCAYMGLAVLLLAWRVSRGPVSWQKVILIWFMIGCYGAFDELTQPLVGRDADVMDWLADMTGAAIGLAVVWLFATWFFRPRPIIRGTVKA